MRKDEINLHGNCAPHKRACIAGVTTRVVLFEFICCDARLKPFAFSIAIRLYTHMLIESHHTSEEIGEVFERVADYFALLSEPMRLRILYALCDGDRPVADIVAVVGSTQANVSRHLNLLYRAKLLLRRKEGAQVFYRIGDRNALALCKTVCADVIADLEQQKAGKRLALKKRSG